MKKTIMNRLRVLGCIVLSASIVLSACKSEETKKKNKKTKKTTTEDTEPTDDTEPSVDPTTDTAVPTDTSAVPSVKTYTGDDASKRLHELDEEIFVRGEEDIITMYYDLENPETFGLEWPEEGILPWDPSEEDEDYEFCKYVLDTLDQIDFDSLETEDQILLLTMQRDYQLAVDSYGMNYYVSSINSLTGINVELPMVFATMTFDDKDDVERYFLMLEDSGIYLDSLFEYEKKRAELGRSLPDEKLQNVIDSIEVVYKDHEGNYMYSSFEERIEDLGLDDATKQDLIKRNAQILDDVFFPAYERLGTNMKTLLGTAKTSGKICEMDGGKEFYEYYFKSRSGTNLSIDEAMEVLETAMIEDIMELQDIYSRLTAAQQAALDSDLEYTNGSFEKDLEFCKNAIKQDFPDLGDVKYIVYHVPESLADNFSPAAYMSSPYDDITKNLLMINDYSDGASDLLPTVGHEAFPGHMYQAVYHMLNMNSFYQKGGTTAYKEGWSTYCEDYIMKLTTYDYDVYRANYVWLMLMINYVAETIMDIGVHYYGWTEKDAANYFDQMLGGLGTALVDSFYDRIIEIPCYCTPYCFGNYFCCKIINDAVAKYGNDYSMMQIHKAYLDMGPSYFELLQEYMPIYVEKQK